MSAQLSKIYGKFHDSLWGERGLSIFLYLLFLSFFLASIVDSLPVRLLTSLFFSLFMVFGVISMSRQPALRLFAGSVAVVALVLRWLMHILPTPGILRWSSLATLIFMIMLTLMMLFKVFKESGPVTVHKIRGAIAVYLLFGLTWSILYGLLDQLLPLAFSLPQVVGMPGVERQQILTYFSFVTLTTVGYGDITPTHDITRMFAILEALCGQLYPATLLARLVSLEVMHREDK
jgi:hypothetical protein